MTDTSVVSEPNSSPHPHGDFDSQQEYQVRNILDERGGKYLIDWEDDPITGQKYKATWEPKENANEKAVSDWERQKASKARKCSTPCANLLQYLYSCRKVACHPVQWRGRSATFYCRRTTAGRSAEERTTTQDLTA